MCKVLEFEHFSPDVGVVTPDVRQALLNLAEYVKGELDTYSKVEAFGEVELDTISGVAYDGFIPWQLGGYEVSCLIRCDADSGHSIPCSGMAEHAEAMRKLCFEDFLEDKKLPKITTYDDLTEEQVQELWDCEDEYLQPALLQFECWQSEVGGWRNDAGKVMLRLSVNYADAPYYRSKYATTLHELNLAPEVLLEAGKRWPNDWQERIWRQLVNSKPLGGGLNNV